MPHNKKDIVALQLMLNQSLPEAKAFAERWIEESNDSFEALQFYGFVCVKENNMNKAHEYFTRAHLLNPQEASIHVNLSNVCLALQDIDSAINHLTQALRLQPFHAEAYCNLGLIYYKQGRISEGIPYFEKALRLDAHYWQAHYNLAHSLASQNQLTRAATHYEEVIKLVPNHATTHFNLGIAYLFEENHPKAEVHLRKTLELDKNNIEAKKRLGEIYIAKGSISDAIQIFEDVLLEDPTIAEVQHNIAILYLRNNAKERALSHFMRALEIDPTNETARHMILSLSQDQNVSAAPKAYIAQLFDQYADYYNDHLKHKLQYQVPALLRNAIGQGLGANPKAGRVLDIGCGTGLCGIVFRDLALELIGIDISPKMIEKASLLGAYDSLKIIDIQEYLSQKEIAPFNIIIAGDVLVYRGELEEIFYDIAKALVINGRFAFSTEYLDTGNYHLQVTGRFAHSSTYIHTLANQFNFLIEIEEEVIPRYQEGASIKGQLYVLKFLGDKKINK